MDDKNSNIMQERQDLLNKAESYFEELELAREDLEESSKKIGRNLLIFASIGIGVAFTYKLFSGDKKENKTPDKPEEKTYKKPSRFGSAMKAIAVPFLLGIAKNVVFSSMNSGKNESDGGNP